MRIHNLYVDDKGETHFRDIEVNGPRKVRAARRRTPSRRPASSSARRPDLRLCLAPGAAPAIHHQPRRPVSIEASDGEKRIIGAGEVLLVEDTHGKGHFSRAVEGKMRHSIFVPIE